MKVDSKRAPDHGRYFELRQFLELRGNLSGRGQVPAHLRIQKEQFEIARVDTGREWYAPEPPPYAPENQFRPKPRLVIPNALCAAWSDGCARRGGFRRDVRPV